MTKPYKLKQMIDRPITLGIQEGQSSPKCETHLTQHIQDSMLGFYLLLFYFFLSSILFWPLEVHYNTLQDGSILYLAPSGCLT